jgi:hypothetical protein
VRIEPLYLWFEHGSTVARLPCIVKYSAK